MNELRDNRKLDEQVDREVEIVIHHHRVVVVYFTKISKQHFFFNSSCQHI